MQPDAQPDVQPDVQPAVVPPARRDVLALAPPIVVAVVAIAFFVTGVRGIDFGQHWDEARHLNAVRATTESGLLLPRTYWYPSMTYALTFVSAAPELVESAFAHSSAPVKVAVHDSSFTLRVRTVFLALSTCAFPLLYLAVVRFRKNAWEGALAAALLASSWELAYHARWIAPDAILATFASLLLLALASLSTSRSAYWIAVVAAGLATSSKYTSGLMLVPVFVALWQQTAVEIVVDDERRRLRIRRFVATCAVFGAVYLAITPGTIIEAPRFWWDLTRQAEIYGDTGHKGYTPDGHIAFVFELVRYFAVAFFSPFVPLSIALFAFVFVGARRAFVDDRRNTVLLASFAVVFLVFFATQKTLIVRNFLVVTPTLAMFAAIGASSLVRFVRDRRRVVGHIVLGLIAVVVAVDVAYLVHAGETIHDRRSARFLADFAAYLDQHAGEPIVVAPQLKATLAAFEHRNRDELVDAGTSSTTKIAGFARELLPRADWPANDPFLTERVFGSLEVNFDVYPTWIGDDRSVVMSLDKARAIGVPLAK